MYIYVTAEDLALVVKALNKAIEHEESPEIQLANNLVAQGGKELDEYFEKEWRSELQEQINRRMESGDFS